MIRKSKINGLTFIIIIFAVLLFSTDLFAHKIYVFAWTENGKVYTESRFSSNKWVKNAKISVKDDQGNILLTGTTSEDGSFVFPVPENIKSDLLIELDAGMGHKAEWKLEFDDNLEKAQKKKQQMIKQPDILNVSLGILIIFAFFIFIAYYNRKKLNKHDRK